MDSVLRQCDRIGDRDDLGAARAKAGVGANNFQEALKAKSYNERGSRGPRSQETAEGLLIFAVNTGDSSREYLHTLPVCLNAARDGKTRLSPEAILVNLERTNLRFQRGPRDP